MLSEIRGTSEQLADHRVDSSHEAAAEGPYRVSGR